jgi:hypothetical protein
MKKLLKFYGFKTVEQYFDMCVESVINGQRAQAREQFKAMPKALKKQMCNYLNNQEHNKEYFNFFFNEL